MVRAMTGGLAGDEQVKACVGIKPDGHAEIDKFQQIKPAFPVFGFGNPGMGDLQAGGQGTHGNIPCFPTCSKPVPQCLERFGI